MVSEFLERDNFYLASVMVAEGIGSITAKVLLDFFKSGENIWYANESDLRQTKLSERKLNALLNLRKNYPECPNQLFDFCREKHINLCSINDSDYPSLLKSIVDPPVLFYYRGSLLSETPRISIVGTRGATSYGIRVATNLSEQLACLGITVVSGAAYGIDTAAHKGALKSGRTVAVLGEGLAVVSSRDKQLLLDQIIDNGGVVISENPPNRNASIKGVFPMRNRIIAGLSTGVVVVEAGKSSGALNTAQHVNENGRLLFVIPGSIYAEKSKGCHELIRDGATLIRTVNDIIDDCKFNFDFNHSKPKVIGLPPLEGKEELIFNTIPSDNSISIDDILIQVDEINISELSMILIKLECQGYIKEDLNGNYVREYGIY